MRTLLFLTITVFSLPAISADLPGIFNNMRCRMALAEIAAHSESRYRQEAIARGAASPEQVNEHVERRKRVRYLVEDAYSAKIERALANEIFELIEALGTFKDLKVRERKEVLARVFEQAKERIGAEGGAIEEISPTFYPLVRDKPPKNLQEAELISELMKMKLGMAMYRAEISLLFADLPLDKRVNEASLADLYAIHYSVLASLTKSPYKKEIESELARAFGPEPPELRAEIEQTRKTADAILASEAVPFGVKAEISMHRDFQSKYNNDPMNLPMYRRYVELVAKYYGI